ncbi:MAG: hypothetical protein ACLFMO_04235 [Eubacteriales bacterium]
MKLLLEDFLEEVKLEMTGYEEIDEDLIKNWECRAKDWVYLNIGKKNRIIKENNSIYVEIDDESEIFKVVDRYFSAIDNNETEKYWQGFFLI